jgi:hypothetical protein
MLRSLAAACKYWAPLDTRETASLHLLHRGLRGNITYAVSLLQRADRYAALQLLHQHLSQPGHQLS